jgi:hypothetical protein
MSNDQKISVDIDIARVMTANGPLRVFATGDNAPAKISDDEFGRLPPAERLDRVRQFNQKQFLADGRRQDDAAMPPWKDPRI